MTFKRNDRVRLNAKAIERGILKGTPYQSRFGRVKSATKPDTKLVNVIWDGLSARYGQSINRNFIELVPEIELMKKELLEGISMCDGYEVPRLLWPIAEVLEKEGIITLGGARGPNRDWRRAELVDNGDDT